MPTNKNRVMFLCDDEAKNDLQQWAEQERRSVSNLVEKIVLEAIAAWKQQQPSAPESPPLEPGSKSRGKKTGGGE
ncbi:hypothetical protein H6F96_10140 [Microcoleus sp. FACHB-53]|nr:hypothetical protein [Microcoleus sp. FACHB-53]